MCNTPSTREPRTSCCRFRKCGRHPTTGIGEPMERQAGLIIALECMRVLSVVDQEELELAVSHKVSPQAEW